LTRILVVDNDPAARRVIRTILTSAGYEVSEAENGMTALELIRTQRLDAIVLDVLMPVMNGRDMFLRLKDEGQHPPVVILSAYDAERERRELGAEASLDKPFTPEDLLEVVDALLRDHPLGSPETLRPALDLRSWQIQQWPRLGQD
jgi:DNA-binding response OmpR family regulator